MVLQPASSVDEWPDGIVDRGVQCDVWADKIEIEMSVGLSDGTVLEALTNRLGADAELADSVEGRLDQLRMLINDELAREISVKIDGESVELTPIRTEISARHHIRFYCYLEAQIMPRAGSVELQLIDNSFSDLQNQLRIALRGRGIQLERSNVPPLIVRCERVYMIDLSPADAQDARTIRGAFLDPNVEVQTVEPQDAELQDVEQPNDKIEEPPINTSVSESIEIPTYREQPATSNRSRNPTQIAISIAAIACLVAGLWMALRQRQVSKG